MKFFKQLKNLVSYLPRTLAITLLLAVIIFIVIALPNFFSSKLTPWNKFSPILTLCCFTTAIFVIWKSWVEQLPKRLTVRFMYKDDFVMVCENAYLAGEGDIRVWSQQIGRQMVGENLHFEPFIKQGKPTTGFDENSPYRKYIVIFYLTQLPIKLQKEFETKTLVWERSVNQEFKKQEKWLTHEEAKKRF